MLPPPFRLPRATYRFQFTPDFTLDHGRALIPYLKELGISEIYSSPLFQASAASSHGYDVNDYNSISRAVGGRDGLDRLSADLRKADLGLLLDFVPNHMGIDGEFNGWWSHVLENGPQSKYAAYFDIEWHPRVERLNDRVLVPMLGDRYGTALVDGKLKLVFNQGRFFIHYGALKLPIRPSTYGPILRQVSEHLFFGDEGKKRLHELADAFESLSGPDLEKQDEDLRKLKEKLAEAFSSTRALDALKEVLVKFNGVPGNGPSFAQLHDLLEHQNYRLTHWKVGAHEVNYRRFFAVDTLIGLKMENPIVFAATHQLLGDLLSSRVVTGIRLDHIDGLWNPAEYLERLRDFVADKVPGANPAYTLVEKILASGEEMPKAWAIHGTSGYEFAGNLIELFLDRADESAWSRIYGDFTGDTESSRDLTYRDKIFILEEMFPNAVSNLAVELDSLIEHDWQWRDLSLHDLKTGLRHLLACLPVYRTYRMPGEKMVEEERKWVRQAVEEGLRRNPSVDPEPIRFLGRVIMGDYPPVDILSEYRESFDRWVCKLEQVTGAIMAKSVEDTHFYRYVRMLATNEVGSHPSRFGQPVGEFHRSNRLRQQQMPFCLLTTSTHDTKVSEDARARLFALAELPEEWETKLREWHGMNEKARTQIAEKTAPDEREQYMLYQMMLAAWPLGASMADDVFRQRIKSYFRKAQGEAKLNTAWTFPHEPWHEAGGKFLDAILSSESFLKSFVPFAERVARRGMIYSLGQTVLKLTSPGVPDIYQGNEVWDFSLVDPDNRRPVDYELRRGLLAGLDKRTPKDLWTNWQDGGIKMQTVRAILRFRTDFPELFTRGEYTPLTPEGEDADRVVSFMRSHGGRDLVVVAARRLGTNDASWVGDSWKGIRLPELKRRGWSNLLTGASIKTPSEGLAVAELFADWPVAVLLSDAE